MNHPAFGSATLVEEAARLFSQFGYAVSSVDLVEHKLRVGDGERLAEAAFDLAVERLDGVLYEAIDAECHAADQLTAVVRVFRDFAVDPPVAGGCPVFSATAASGTVLPFFQGRARDVVSGWRRHVRKIVRRGIKMGEIHPAADAEEVASIIIGTMEGAIFLYRIYGDPSHLDRAVDYLDRYLIERVRA